MREQPPTSSAELAVLCKGVTKTYSAGGTKVHALRGVDLDIRMGELMMLVGPSGCGKTTLISVIAGILDRDEGECRVFGEDFDRMSTRSRTRLRGQTVGFVFQQFNLIPTLSARENVELPGLLSGEDAHAMSLRSAELLDRLGIAPRASHRPDALSGGEQQRVAIARALLFSPTLVLADEPTGNLDSASSEQLWTLLGELAKERAITVLMVTHEPAAAAHCRRVFVLKDGQVTGTIESEGMDAGGVAARYQLCVGAA